MAAISPSLPFLLDTDLVVVGDGRTEPVIALSRRLVAARCLLALQRVGGCLEEGDGARRAWGSVVAPDAFSGRCGRMLVCCRRRLFRVVCLHRLGRSHPLLLPLVEAFAVAEALSLPRRPLLSLVLPLQLLVAARLGLCPLDQPLPDPQDGIATQIPPELQVASPLSLLFAVEVVEPRPVHRGNNAHCVELELLPAAEVVVSDVEAHDGWMSWC